jgi:hypothetical protein
VCSATIPGKRTSEARQDRSVVEGAGPLHANPMRTLKARPSNVRLARRRKGLFICRATAELIVPVRKRKRPISTEALSL